MRMAGGRGGKLIERDAMAFKSIGIDFHRVLKRLTAIADHVDDAGHLPELLLQYPVLRRLQIAQRIARPAQDVSIDFSYRVPGRELRDEPRRESDELQSIDDPLLRLRIARLPGEIALHVGEAEARLRADVVEVDHPREGRLH